MAKYRYAWTEEKIQRYIEIALQLKCLFSKVDCKSNLWLKIKFANSEKTFEQMKCL